jgi:hypothetical protein
VNDTHRNDPRAPASHDLPPGRSQQHGGRRALAGLLAIDVALPLALFYGLRAAGVSPWLALVLGAAVPLLRPAGTVIAQRRVDLLSLFSLSLIGAGTAIGLVTADPTLLLARESYLTAVVGL